MIYLIGSLFIILVIAAVMLAATAYREGSYDGDLEMYSNPWMGPLAIIYDFGYDGASRRYKRKIDNKNRYYKDKENK